jgi:hypothetical protein
LGKDKIVVIYIPFITYYKIIATMKGSRIDRNRKENPYNNPFSNEKNWIGGDLPSETAPNASPGQLSVDRTRNEWIEKREEARG